MQNKPSDDRRRELNNTLSDDQLIETKMFISELECHTDLDFIQSKVWTIITTLIIGIPVTVLMMLFNPSLRQVTSNPVIYLVGMYGAGLALICMLIIEISERVWMHRYNQNIKLAKKIQEDIYKHHGTESG